MSCAGCPGVETLTAPVYVPPVPAARRANPPKPEREPLGYVAYGGGAAIRQLSLIGMTLPKGVLSPQFHGDGVLEFTDGDPGEIDGYQRSADNPLLFQPLWLFCQRRLMGAVVAPFKIVAKCIETAAPTFNQFVSHADCSACPFRVKLVPDPPTPGPGPGKK